MSRTECARQGAEAIGAKTRVREGYPVFRTIRSVPFSVRIYVHRLCARARLRGTDCLVHRQCAHSSPVHSE
eukprot:3287283-Prymnesium_polylepis.1